MGLRVRRCNRHSRPCLSHSLNPTPKPNLPRTTVPPAPPFFRGAVKLSSPNQPPSLRCGGSGGGSLVGVGGRTHPKTQYATGVLALATVQPYASSAPVQPGPHNSSGATVRSYPRALSRSSDRRAGRRFGGKEMGTNCHGPHLPPEKARQQGRTHFPPG